MVQDHLIPLSSFPRPFQGYEPALGEIGSINDYSSDLSLNTIIEVSVSLYHGARNHQLLQDESILDLWPVQELIRGSVRLVLRGWPSRWRDNGGRFFGGGCMMARVVDPIWRRISRFVHPFPPFDFNSGMRVRDIERELAEDLGVIRRNEAAPQPQNTPIPLSLKQILEILFH